MQAASWPFEPSLAVFLVIAFASQALAVATRSRLSLQLGLGAICIAGFASGLFPPDFVEKSKMKDVGFIAFNVLVVHSGTLVDFGALRREWRSVAVVVVAIAAMTAAFAVGLAPVFGWNLAIIAAGPVVGGGAACAIASNVLAGASPRLAVFPWLVFMMQGLVGAPFCAWALARSVATAVPVSVAANGSAANSRGPAIPVGAGAKRTADAVTGAGQPERQSGRPRLCDRLPDRYKSTAYYLGALMVVSVFNRWSSGVFFARMGLGINVTALIFGMLLGRFGLLDKNPLAKSDSFGFLMLGLMALMANAMARTPVGVIAALALPAIVAAVSGALVLAVAGAAAGRLFGLGAWHGAALAVNCTVGFPTSLGRIPAFAAGSMLAGNILSIIMPSIAGLFLTR